MPASPRQPHRVAGFPAAIAGLPGLALAAATAAALAPAPARANDRDLRGTPVPAAACVEYRRSPDLAQDPWKAGYFALTGVGSLQLRCPWPVNNVDLSGTTDDNDLTKIRVHYRDSDGFGGGAGVQVVLGMTVADASGNARNTAVCMLYSNAHGTGATTTTKATRACAHDLAAGAFYTRRRVPGSRRRPHRPIPRHRLPALGRPRPRGFG